MRYFFSAAGNTFHVGSSRLTLKLFRLSELSWRVGRGAMTGSGGGAVEDEATADGRVFLSAVEGGEEDWVLGGLWL